MPRASSAGMRLRCRRACDSCKRRKQKCNGEQPCAICVQRRKESECHFSDKPARFLKPSAARETMLLTENAAPSPQGQTAMDRLLNSLEDHSANLEQQPRDERDGTAPVPKVARLLRDGQGKFMYIGDSASLSFLQSVRRIVSASIGRCEFTEDSSRHSMLEAFQSNPRIQSGVVISPPRNEEAQQLAHQYVLATSPLLDLFDLNEFHPRLASWVENPSGDEDTVSSIFYLVLAIGAQVSSTNQSLAEQYFVTGRQLAFSAFTETPSLHTIQSYVLISMYMLGACRRNGAFMNLGVAVRAAYAVGIHRRDANTLFCARERRARERVWRSLRMVDLFLSASLGRPPATSDFDYDAHENPIYPEDQQPRDQVSLAVTALCRIFERILTDVYMKQVVSISVAEAISNQHRAWVRSLPAVLKQQTEQQPEPKPLEDSLAAAHVLCSYYWSIILLTRPFLVYRVSRYVKSKNEAADWSEPRASNSRIALFADACVYSALRALDTVSDLSQYPSLPRRLPFLINSVFNSAIVLGAAFFADYDNLLPLEDGMDKAERFLDLFIPHDPHSCRFFQIIRYLRSAVSEYVRRRNRQWMHRRSKQVDQLFGQLAHDPTTINNSSAASPPPPPPPPAAAPNDITPATDAQSPVSLDNVTNPPPPPPVLSQLDHTTHQNPPSNDDIWDTLCPAPGLDPSSPQALAYDAAISALTTTGIPLGACSPGGAIPPTAAPYYSSSSSAQNQLQPSTSSAAAAGGVGSQATPASPTAAARGQTPLSDMLVPDNGLLYMAEDLPVFGIWGDE